MWKSLAFALAGRLFEESARSLCSRDLEAERVRRQEAVGRILGNLTHRLRTPLSVVRAADRSLRVAGKPPDEISNPALRSILGATEELETLARELDALVPTRITRPRQRLDLAAALVERREEIAERLGEIPFEIAAPDPAEVELESGALDAILSPLLDNARDALRSVPRHGEGATTPEVVLSVERIRVTEPFARRHPAARPGEFAVLGVRDRGPGMEPVIELRAFDPFFSTRGPHRSGLGLPRLHGVVARHDGFVLVESAPGAGTLVAVHLPRIEG